MNILNFKFIREISLKAANPEEMMQNTTATQLTPMNSMKPLGIGQWTSDFRTFEQSLFKNTAPEEIYFIGSCGTSQKYLPSILKNIIDEFNSCWNKKDKYTLDKVTVHNFYYIPRGNEKSKTDYPGMWKHFSHTGCVIVFNPNDIDFILQMRGEPEEYSLVAGGMIFIKTNAMFRYLTEEKSSKLKHMVVYSFTRKV